MDESKMLLDTRRYQVGSDGCIEDAFRNPTLSGSTSRSSASRFSSSGALTARDLNASMARKARSRKRAESLIHLAPKGELGIQGPESRPPNSRALFCKDPHAQCVETTV